MKRKIVSLTLAALLTLTAAPDIGRENRSAMTSAVTASAYDSTAGYESDALESYAREVAALVNKERASNGLSALKLSPVLSKAANVRAQEIQSVFSHTRPDGRSCFTALTEAGVKYRYAAENIAYGQKTPAAVMNAWMNSSGHRANILSANAEYIGIGVKYKNGTYYWSQFFAKADGLSGEVISDGNGTVTTTAPKVTSVPGTTKSKKTTTAKAVTTKKTTTTAKKTTTAKTTTKKTTTKKTTTKKAVTTKKAAVTTAACSSAPCDTAKALSDCLQSGLKSGSCGGLGALLSGGGSGNSCTAGACTQSIAGILCALGGSCK